jgi:acyl-CoA oxidase
MNGLPTSRRSPPPTAPPPPPAGSVLNLGTERHRRAYFSDIDAFRLPGCFAMTELRHGSNVAALQTEAVLDLAADEWVVTTPDDGAIKWWIGNAAEDGRAATVFARLKLPGAEGAGALIDHGVHAFIVPLRDAEGKCLPGIEIRDCGYKVGPFWNCIYRLQNTLPAAPPRPREASAFILDSKPTTTNPPQTAQVGLNGVDNGAIRFTRARVPRGNLLDRFATVDAHGRYASPLPTPGRRFAATLGELTGGRVGLTSASVGVLKGAVTIAVRYGALRAQFGPPDAPEVAVLDYPSQQLKLMPMLATAYTLHFAKGLLIAKYAEAKRTKDEAAVADVHALSAGLKAYTTAYTNTALSVCREACGGHGCVLGACVFVCVFVCVCVSGLSSRGIFTR